ncbi:MAG: two-component system, NarL family, nitrate/nitrite response regulator NarL [Solirubrobacterales bacterium]|jgi:DNA-binding CsgD family transcriptional regulator|nr:two-component system, NarL family, nitrate/nitrite response regulator NarL [Solirubrobacterales bacterium]
MIVLSSLDSEFRAKALPPYASGRRLPPVLGDALEVVLAAKGQADKLRAVFDLSPIPMTMHDGGRQHIDANRPAQLMARSSLADMQRLTVNDFMPPDQLPVMDAIWVQMLDTGLAAGPGPRVLTGRLGAPMEIVIWGMANALPGLHLFACVPTYWSKDEIGVLEDEIEESPGPPLTPRELEVLQLAADGFSTPAIAERLILSPATVTTHFGNIYLKLSVPGRAAAVAKAMRLGLIA